MKPKQEKLALTSINRLLAELFYQHPKTGKKVVDPAKMRALAARIAAKAGKLS
jgi:hypothetical protein